MRFAPSIFRVAGLCALFGACQRSLPSPRCSSPACGKWRATSSQQPDRKSVTTMCLDESVQAQMREFGMGATKEMCSQSDRNFDGNKMTMTATCKLGQTTMKTTSVMTFNGNTSYHMDGTATYDPPMASMKEMKTSVDARWVGACRPGQQPGDVTLETGQTVNIKQMMGNKK